MYRKVSANPMRGAAAVEFAIVLIPLVAIVFGIIECSLLFYDKAVITNACREGARRGVVYRSSSAHYASPTEIINTVNNYCSTYLIGFPASSPGITMTPSGGATTTGNDLKVTVTYVYNFLVLPSIVKGSWGPITLSAVTVMRTE